MAAVSAAGLFTHLFGRRIEVDVNGGWNHRFSGQSGINTQFGNLSVHPGRADSPYYDVRRRIG